MIRPRLARCLWRWGQHDLPSPRNVPQTHSAPRPYPHTRKTERGCTAFKAALANFLHLVPELSKRNGRKANSTGRSEGQERFVQIPYWVLESPAARMLSPTAFKLLVYILKRFNGMNNGRIAFGVRSGCFVRKADGGGAVEDTDIGLKPSTIADAIFELVGAGFIAFERDSLFTGRRGTIGQGVVREWRLTWLPSDGKLPTKDFVAAKGRFRRPKTQPKNKLPVRHGALYGPPQCATAYSFGTGEPQNTPHSAPRRTNGSGDSAPRRTHLVTIGSGEQGPGELRHD